MPNCFLKAGMSKADCKKALAGLMFGFLIYCCSLNRAKAWSVFTPWACDSVEEKAAPKDPHCLSAGCENRKEGAPGIL